MEKFEGKMEGIHKLETTLEECLDQNNEITYPAIEGSSVLNFQHEKYSKNLGIPFLLTIPLRNELGVIGAIHLQRSSKAFQMDELEGLRVICDQSASLLNQAKSDDKWLGAKLLSNCKSSLEKTFKTEHIFRKLMIIGFPILLILLSIIKTEYRVEAKFLLKSEQQALIPSTLKGYVKEVFHETGDAVKKGQTLMSLDDTSLRLKQTALLADLFKYQNEATRAKSQRKYAEMKVAQAEVKQTESDIALVRHHIMSSQIRSPITGLVVEGRFKEKIGALVREGDILYRVATIRPIYLEIEIPEHRIHEIKIKQTGDAAFISRPDLKFPFKLSRLELSATPKESGNYYISQGTFLNSEESWFRPGMTGLVKIGIEKRSILWILTHDLIDVLRLKLWY